MRRIDLNIRSWLARLALTGMLVLAVLGSCGGSAFASTPGATASIDLLSSQLNAYAGPLGPYHDGVWTSSDAVCWACDQGGPATADATLYVLTGESRSELLRQAEATIDVAIAGHQMSNGAFRGISPDIETAFFGVEEGTTYLELSPVLGARRRARWQASLSAAASYLIRNGNLSWYTNGNINLANIELLFLAWRATGDEKFHAAYDKAWEFTLHPPQDRWPGRGLVIVRAPTRANGADGSGYLTETGSDGTGFDAEYSELQLDVASRLYLLSGDPRALRLANLLVNMLLPRIQTTDWLLNTSDGTRHTQPVRTQPLITSAFAVLGLHGGRADLVPDIAPQLQAVSAQFATPGTASGAVFRRALGNDISVIALATNSKQAPGRLLGAARDGADPPRRHSSQRARRR
jgi:hypothetical protein